MARQPPWTRDEIILALDMYLPARRLPDKTEEKVVELSDELRRLPAYPEHRTESEFRSPGAVVMKLANLRRLDPQSTRQGLGAGSRLDSEIWDRFADDQASLRREARKIRAAPNHWLKLVYNHDRDTGARVWRDRHWVSDHHRRRVGGAPTHRPGYAVGDELVVYDLEFQRCPARLQVRAGPVFDPDRVEREGSSADSARWGWLTETNTLATVDVRNGPTLGELGVDPLSVREHDHVTLEQWQYAEAARLLPGRTRRSRRRDRRAPSTRVETVPIEAMNVESTEVRQEPGTRTIRRREQRLVLAYADYLEDRGRSVARRKISVAEGHGNLWCDLFEDDRRNLVEAKASVTRGAVRMAIGQLADYSQFCGDSVHQAVLLPTRPSPDLERLLSSQGISAIWQAADHFEDNARGRFT